MVFTSIDPVMECNVGRRYFVEILKECSSSSLDEYQVPRTSSDIIGHEGGRRRGGHDDDTQAAERSAVEQRSNRRPDGNRDCRLGWSWRGVLWAAGLRGTKRPGGKARDGRYTSTCLLGTGTSQVR